jgi:predicted amidophosphoribosyltransferase
MVCKKCSANIPNNGIFCPMCGTRVERNTTCTKCNKEIPKESAFCTYCGTSVKENNAAVCATEIENKQPIVENDIIAPIDIPVALPANVAMQNSNENDVNDDAELEDDSFEEDEDYGVEAIVCPQCGSTNIELISEELGKCKNCGTQITINTPKEANVVTNNVNINMVASDDAKMPIKFLELPKILDEKTFYVDALTKIALNKNSPDDIFKEDKFEPIKTQYCQYMLALGNVDMTYSATIGYDREEVYYEKQKRYKDGLEYYEDVRKTRTVTDWKPFSGVHKGKHFGSTPNGGDEIEGDLNDYTAHCIKNTKSYNSKKSTCPSPKAPTSETINLVKRSIETDASATCIGNLPGDRYKDYSDSCNIDLTLIECHVAPKYVLDYTYLEKKFSLRAHTVKESEINGQIPSAKSQNENQIENHKLVKTFNLLTFFTLIFSILSSILFPIALKITFGVIGVALFIAYYIIRSKISKIIYKEKENIKKNDLITLLKAKGLKIPDNLKGGI